MIEGLDEVVVGACNRAATYRTATLRWPPFVGLPGGGIKLGSIAVKPPVSVVAVFCIFAVAHLWIIAQHPRKPRRASARRAPNADAVRRKISSTLRFHCALPPRPQTRADKRTRISATAIAAL